MAAVSARIPPAMASGAAAGTAAGTAGVRGSRPVRRAGGPASGGTSGVTGGATGGAGAGIGAFSAPAATAGGVLALFLVTLILPINFELGGLKLSPVRLFLLAGFVPMLVRLISGSAGRLTVGDLCFGLYGLWMGLAMVAVHGPSRIPFAGISIVEAAGGYLAGRVLIRHATDYRTFFRYFLITLAFLAPFAVIENLTGRMLISEALSPLFQTHPKVLLRSAEDYRMGLVRAQGVVEHSILWGVFCSIAIANAFYLYRETFARSVMLSGFALAMTFTSLSSGPLLSAMLQLGMIGWGWATRNAWWVLVGLAVAAYVVIDLISNRSGVQVLISYLTFNPGNAYWRLHIWNYGSAEVLRHPLFGIGLNDWVRPSWMATASVDNFWLNVAMRYGLPALIFLAAGIIATLVQILRRRDLPEALQALRTGHVIALVGTILALTTVHIWGSTGVLVMFYVGAGGWLATASFPAEPAAAGTGSEAIPSRGPGPRRSLAASPAGAVAAEAAEAEATAAEAAAEAPAGSRRSPTEAERLARRRAQYSSSRQRP